MGTNNTFQLKPVDPSTIDNAEAGQLRFMLNLAGLLVTKDENGVVTPIGVVGGGGPEEFTLTTNDDTLTTIFTLDASTTDRIYKVSFDLEAVSALVEQSPNGAKSGLYRASAQFMNINGVLYEIAFPFETLEESPALEALDIVGTISGTDVLFQVKGLPGTDVKWLMEVTESSLISFTSTAPP